MENGPYTVPEFCHINDLHVDLWCSIVCHISTNWTAVSLVTWLEWSLRQLALWLGCCKVV